MIQAENLSRIFVHHKTKPGIAGSFLGLFSRERTEFCAVDRISFQIKEGDFVGYLGPNGAGKSTTIKQPKHPSQMDAWVWNGVKLKGGTRIAIEFFKNPVFITHGMQDELWEPDRSLRIKKTLEDAGLHPELHFFQGEKHVFKLPAENERKELLLKFFRRTL